MDRAEKIGLGTAVGLHALLLAAFGLGLLMSAERLTPPKGISVSLVGEDQLSTAPDAVQEETAPPASGETQSYEPPPPEVVTPPQPQPTIKPSITPPAKPSTQKVVTKQPVTPAKPVKPNTTSKPAAQPGGFNLDLDKITPNKGKNPTGKGEASGTTANKSAAEYRTAASATIGAEVAPLVRGCAPSTSDNSSLFVYVALQISKSASLVSANIYDVQGVTPGNQAQVEPMKQCVLNSLRAASPYNLDPDGYDTWKNHKVKLKVNFK